MDTTDTQKPHGGIVNYFQGATIHNLVINGNMTKNGDEHYHEAQHAKTERTVSAGTVTRALRECKAYVWGNAAYAVVFCICRERYGWQDNASLFERTLEQQGVSLPEGTLNNALSRNSYLRLPMDKWEASGAMERVVRLRDEFIAQVERLLTPQEKST